MERIRISRSLPPEEDLEDEVEEVRASPTNSPPAARFEKSSRSALTNGSVLVANADKRSPWVRRFRDVVHLLEDHLGGPEAVSEVQKSLIKRSAALTVEAERLESRFANAEESVSADLDLFLRTCGHLRRLLVDLGLEKRTGATLTAHSDPTTASIIQVLQAGASR